MEQSSQDITLIKLIIFDDDEEEDIGNIMTMKLEYSSDEEVKQLAK